MIRNASAAVPASSLRFIIRRIVVALVGAYGDDTLFSLVRFVR